MTNEIAEKMREEIMQMSDVLGDKINDLLEYRGISDCGKSMRGGCDEIIMPYITRKFLELLRQSHLALLEQMIGENESHRISADVPTSLEVPEDVLAEMHRDMKQFRNGHSLAIDLINTDLRIKIEELKKII